MVLELDVLAWGAGDSRDGMSTLASNGTPPLAARASAVARRRARERYCPPAAPAGAARASREIARATYLIFVAVGMGK